MKKGKTIQQDSRFGPIFTPDLILLQATEPYFTKTISLIKQRGGIYLHKSNFTSKNERVSNN